MARKNHHESSYRNRISNTSEEYDADRHVRSQMRDQRDHDRGRRARGEGIVSRALRLTDRLGR